MGLEWALRHQQQLGGWPPQVSLMAAIGRSWPGRWGLDSETSEFGRLVQVGGISPHLAPCTTTDLWKKLGPSGPQSYGFLSLEAGSGGQACGLLPHPALFLGGLSIPGNILKGRDPKGQSHKKYDCKSMTFHTRLLKVSHKHGRVLHP